MRQHAPLPPLPTASSGPTAAPDIDVLAVDTIRFLAADMVQAAGSGHPGMPMGAAAMAWTLFSRHLRFDPTEPGWPDRDRFVLSAGHGSALQYALLHLLGYDLPLQDLREFRRLGSRTPGHPEFGHTPGVETTTGPLGQGLANGVGMALAERMLAADYPELVDHRTFVMVGDGCLMEGVSHEAASLAGHLGLGRLIVLWDDNRVTIDGHLGLSCSDDQLGRFEACGWHTVAVPDGTDIDSIDAALSAATVDPRPSLIAVRTVIGRGAAGVEGTSKAHGSPLGEDVLAGAKALAGWTYEPFTVPDEVRSRCMSLATAGLAHRRAWETRLADLTRDDPGRAGAWDRRHGRALPREWSQSLADLRARLRPDADARRAGTKATRGWSQQVLTELQTHLPELVGGSADLAGSTGVATGALTVQRGRFDGRDIAFGVREFAMAAALNGMSLHGGFRVFGSTFAVFSDYLRPAVRLSALMGQPVIYVLSHDSVAVGEDGPTHQPVEHIEALRLIPQARVFRPADDEETVLAWQLALEHRSGPSLLLLSRQALPALTDLAPGDDPRLRTVYRDDCARPDVEFLATGSEAQLAISAAARLHEQGLTCQVLSVVEREALVGRERQAALTVSVEAGVTSGWHRFADLCIGVDSFGQSGPAEDVLRAVGLHVESVVDRVREARATPTP